MRLVLIILLLSGFSALRAQCTIQGLDTSYCVNSSSVQLGTMYPGGKFSGAGVQGNSFDPALAGVGTHSIGYEYCSASYSVSQILYSFTTNATWVVALNDNELSNAIPIGFDFRFFCATYNQVYFSSNGFITFSAGGPDGCCQGLPLPASAGAPKNMIALAWTDLNPALGGTLRYETVGTAPNRIFMVNYNCIFHHNNGNGGDAVVGTILLYETSNVIEIHSNTKPAPAIPLPTTMGIQDSTGTLAYAVPGRNGTSGWSANNDAYRFTPGPACSATALTRVKPAPNVTIAWQRPAICRGEWNRLYALGAQSYTWSSSDTSYFINISPSVSTVYTVTGTSPAGCVSGASLNVIVNECTAIGVESGSSIVSIWPNPATEHLNLLPPEDCTMSIYDSKGSLQRSVMLSGQKSRVLSLEEYSPGIYLCVLTFGDKRLTKRLVVSR